MNKRQTKDYIRENIIKKYSPGINLSDEDFRFMLEVLADHENAEEKIGAGVKRMWLDESIYGQKHFMLGRVDGTIEDFSFLKCFSKSSPKSNYLKACRRAVESIVIYFRNSVFGNKETITCPILNIPITRHESQVDHDLPYPFITIARMFCEENDIDLCEIKYIHKIGVEFYNKDLERRWIEYHNKYAKLRVISAIANQKIKKQKWL